MVKTYTGPSNLFGEGYDLIHTLVKRKGLTIISGASGSGKTTWLMQMLIEYGQGKPVFGYESYPEKFVYYAFDRDNIDTLRIQQKLGFTFPSENLSTMRKGQGRPKNFLQLIEHARKNHGQDVKLLGVDIFMRLGPGKLNDYQVMGQWMESLMTLCDQEDITIIGTAHDAKAKKGEGYENTRQKAGGSGIISGMAGTVIDMDGENKIIDISLRNSPSRQFKYSLEGGRVNILEEIDNEGDLSGAQGFVLDAFLMEADTFKFGDVVKYAESKQLSRASAHRWLQKMAAERKVESVERGVYKVAREEEPILPN